MKDNYKPIKSMKEVPEQLRKLRREYVRYQQAELIYSLSHKKLLELASDAGAIYRFDSTVLINRDIFDAYLERFVVVFHGGILLKMIWMLTEVDRKTKKALLRITLRSALWSVQT